MTDRTSLQGPQIDSKREKRDYFELHANKCDHLDKTDKFPE